MEFRDNIIGMPMFIMRTYNQIGIGSIEITGMVWRKMVREFVPLDMECHYVTGIRNKLMKGTDIILIRDVL